MFEEAGLLRQPDRRGGRALAAGKSAALEFGHEQAGPVPNGGVEAAARTGPLLQRVAVADGVGGLRVRGVGDLHVRRLPSVQVGAPLREYGDPLPTAAGTQPQPLLHQESPHPQPPSRVAGVQRLPSGAGRGQRQLEASVCERGPLLLLPQLLLLRQAAEAGIPVGRREEGPQRGPAHPPLREAAGGQLPEDPLQRAQGHREMGDSPFGEAATR